MTRLQILKAALIGGLGAAALASAAHADQFNIPGGDLATALSAYMAQTGVELVVAANGIHEAHTRGAKGDLTADAALSRILQGTGFVSQRDGGAVAIVRATSSVRTESRAEEAAPLRLASASAAASSVETVVVTSSKIKGDIQTVPIAITALSQEQLTSRQIAGGPDLVKEVPNLTFSKTNFTGYNIQIRGIGTQAISVTTDPAVAVAFNDIPFIRNHFFEQEFYDVSQVEVLRGPQGTLYGRNATAGVVNVISAKPTDQFEAMLSADWGNYTNRRYEGMINLPIVDDRLDIRAAAEWTKRDGYSFNELTNRPIDGRDLWSSRITIGFKPSAKLQAYLIWEHFQENDDRIRSGKQLCKTDPVPAEIGGRPFSPDRGADLSQGCQLTSLYSPDAFEVPNGYSLQYVQALSADVGFCCNVDPYASTTQSRNLRVIESALNPAYEAKNDTLELNVDYQLVPAITLTSQTGFNHDFLWSTEDFNRFNTSPGVFSYHDPALADSSGGNQRGQVQPDGVFCDPQLGCTDRLAAEDLSNEHAWQLNQEFRFTSNFSGPLNFSVGGNFLHYETAEDYYVFINALTLFASVGAVEGTRITTPWIYGVSDNHECFYTPYANNGASGGSRSTRYPSVNGAGISNCSYIDPNPIGSLNGEGHNYFRSLNPYVLNSYAGFGEVYYNIVQDLKLTGGLRWTDDQKHFTDIPSQVLTEGIGYPASGVVDQQWNQLTGRAAVNWTPKLDFTDQTLLYGSYAHGYKAGGANPPGAVLLVSHDEQPIHPLTFKPEFVDAFELGTKNTLFDGGLTLNGDVFYYDYKAYQISEIVDRTSINLNFDANIKGAELEASWEPVPGLKFNFAGGYEDARLAKGSKAIDLMDRTAGNPLWKVVKPSITDASNCIFPVYVVARGVAGSAGTATESYCNIAYLDHHDPVTGSDYEPYPTYYTNEGQAITDYPGFDPLAGTPNDPYTGQNTYNGVDYGPVPNKGEGFDKDLSGNNLPNTPHFTTSLSAEYTIPVSDNWAATLHSDFYWQSQSYARVFNDRPYDKLRGYSNVNLALILTSADGWQVLGYLKNIFDTTAITGDFLNSDDTGLTTNVFLTDPRLFGVRVTKNF
mgnify:CR=1 FL=1